MGENKAHQDRKENNNADDLAITGVRLSRVSLLPTFRASQRKYGGTLAFTFETEW